MTCTCFRGLLSIFDTSPSVTPLQPAKVVNVSGSTSATESVLGENENSVDLYTGRSYLTNALLHNDLNVLQRRLLAGADPNALDSLGDSPLQLAVERELVDAVDVLTAFGADPLRPSRSSDLTPLQLAATLNLHEIYSVLLQAVACKHAQANPYADLFGNNLQVGSPF
jgi:ankyrin repeat protein